MLHYRPYVAAALGLATASASANNLGELIANVPSPPKDMAAALMWTKDGQIIEPNYLRFKQALEAERTAPAGLNGIVAIDVVSPPSPDIPDAQEVISAIRGFDSYLDGNSGVNDPKVALNKRTRWLQAAMGQSLAKLMGAMKPCTYPCQDPAIVAANAPLEAQKADMVEHDLRVWISLFGDWKATRTPIVTKASQQLNAAGDGARSNTPQGKMALAQYRAAMLKEIDLTLSITELAVRRTDAIARNAVDAISSATRSGAKPKTN